MLQLFFVIFGYAIFTDIAWKNVRFTQPRKAIFSFTVFPIFLISILLGLWLTDNFLPKMVDVYNNAHIESEKLISQGVRGHNARSGEAGIALLILAPLPVVILVGWFFIFVALERKAKATMLYRDLDALQLERFLTNQDYQKIKSFDNVYILPFFSEKSESRQTCFGIGLSRIMIRNLMLLRDVSIHGPEDTPRVAWEAINSDSRVNAAIVLRYWYR